MQITLRLIRPGSCLIAAAALAQPLALHAQDAPAASQPAASQPAASQPAPAQPRPLAMTGLDTLGFKATLDNLRLNLSGWVEQSYTCNGNNPSDRVNTLRAFDDRSDDYRFNQFSLSLDRPLADGNGFDLGGKVQLLYGSDARFIHALGLADNVDHHTVQFDPEQFYLLLRLPLGNGLTLKAGKYVTPIGFEAIDPTANALYSHSFLFGFSEPFTHTGLELDYPVNDKLGVYYGLVEGWDVWADNNSSFSHMAGLAWTINGKASANLNLMFGPERPNENTDYRSLVDLYSTYKWTDAFSTSVNADFGNESGTRGQGATGNNWYGLAGYATYAFNPQLALTVRGEYFRDQTASRLGFAGELVELTAGLDIHPCRDLPNLRLRPEVRWDQALGGDRPFDAGRRGHQATLGVDLILTF